MARVYLPTTLAGLAAARGVGFPAEADRVAAEDTGEESEYHALMTAADLSADLQPGAGAVRVVVAADVAGVDDAVAWRDIAAVHADLAPDADPDDDLAWYATQEVDDLLAAHPAT